MRPTLHSPIHLSILTSLCLATSLLAGESSPKMMMEPVLREMPEKTWTGFYVGVQGGGIINPDDDGRLAFDTDRDGSYDDSIAAFGDNFEGSFDSSYTFGVHAGYDHQFGRFVIGVLTDINKADVSEEQSGFSSTPAFYREERSFDYLASLRLRAGFAINENFLAYVTGGAAYAEVDYNMDTNTPATVSTSGGDDDDLGYTLGAGLEARVTEHVSLTIEYLYTNLGDGDFTTNLSGPAAFSTVSASTNARGADEEFDFHTVQGKVSFRF